MKAMTKYLLSAAVVLVFLAAPALVPASTDGLVAVPLKSVNGSGQSGGAVLAPTAGGYSVTVTMRGKNIQPGETDHIHSLSCARNAKLAPHAKTPTYAQVNAQYATVTVPLNNIAKGASRTRVTSPLADVTKGGFSINVHEPGYPYVTVACGDIPKR